MNEPQKKPNLLCTFLKAYWWAILIILTVPILLNFIVLIPAFLPIVGGSVEWLSFHGSYIGSIIASLITLYVLYKQLQHNHEENERTRQENQIVNEKNRQLQLKILSYEQETQWLQEMRSACINNIDSYNVNDIREICTAFTFHDYEYISPKIKNIIDKLDYTDTTICSLLPIAGDKYTQTFDEQRQRAYKEYMLMIQDIGILAIFLNKDYETIQVGLPFAHLSSKVKTNVNVQIVVPGLDKKYINAQLASIALNRLSGERDIYESIRTASFNYLKKQQERINKILTEEHGTR